MSDSRQRVARNEPDQPPTTSAAAAAFAAAPARIQIPPGFWAKVSGDPSGVFARGTVTGRSKTVLPADTRTGITRQKVTYRIATQKVDLMVDDFEPPDYIPIGAEVNLPIIIRAYSRRGGTAAYGLTIARVNNLGEEF